MTKSLKAKYRLFQILSLLLTIGPLLYFTLVAFITCDVTSEKVTLSMTVLVCLILTLIGLINKHAFKSKLWLLLIGLYVCLETIMAPLISIAICQVVDELIVDPLKKHYKERFTINKEIDRRL